jgi:hypothetical protein
VCVQRAPFLRPRSLTPYPTTIIRAQWDSVWCPASLSFRSSIFVRPRTWRLVVIRRASLRPPNPLKLHSKPVSPMKQVDDLWSGCCSEILPLPMAMLAMPVDGVRPASSVHY